MLEHEPQETPAPQTFTAQIPAAQRRVSAEDLTRAVSALEDAKAAERMAGVAPIGQVVDELGLDSTPEEIWAQVQKQRAEAAPKPQGQAVPAVQTQQIGRQVRRGWRHSKGWLWVIFWCTGGFGLLAGLPHLLHPQDMTTGQTILIGGDNDTETISVQGKEVVISGDGDKITLTGKAKNVLVSGNSNRLNGTSPEDYQLMGDGNAVKWNTAP